MFRFWPWLLVSCLLLGCSTLQDPLGHRRQLEDAQRSYTQMVRWGDFAAASQWVAAEDRDHFIAEAEQFRDLRITDYEIGPVEVNDDGESATVRVNYRGYHLANLLEREVSEVQDWYRAEGRWQVRPALAGLREELRGLRRP